MDLTSQKLMLVLLVTLSLPLCGMGGGHNSAVIGFLLLVIALAGFILGLLGGVVAGLKRVKNSIGLGATFGLFFVSAIVLFCIFVPRPEGSTFIDALGWALFYVFGFLTLFGGLPLVIGYFLMVSLTRWLVKFAKR